MKKWQLFLVIIVVILIVGFFLGVEYAGGLAGLLGIGLGTKKKVINQAEKKAEKERKRAENIIQKVEDRAESAEELDKEMQKTEDKFKKYFNVFLIFILSVSLFFVLTPVAVMAAEDGQPPPLGKFKQPNTFEEAKQLANDMKDFALMWRDYAYQWQDKYNKEHQDVLAYQNTIKNQQEIIEFYKGIVNQLMSKNKSGGLNVSVGVDYKPIKPLYTGVTFEVGYQF